MFKQKKWMERFIFRFVFSIDLTVCFRMLLVSFVRRNVVVAVVGTMPRSFANLEMS